MINHILLNTIFPRHFLYCKITIAGRSAVIFPTYNVEIHFPAIRIPLVVLSKPCHKSVKAMPIVYFSHSDKMYIILLLWIMQGNAVKVNAIADANSPLRLYTSYSYS